MQGSSSRSAAIHIRQRKCGGKQIYVKNGVRVYMAVRWCVGGTGRCKRVKGVYVCNRVCDAQAFIVDGQDWGKARMRDRRIWGGMKRSERGY